MADTIMFPLIKALADTVERGQIELASGTWTDWYLDAKQVTWGDQGFLATLAVEDVLCSHVLSQVQFNAIGGVSFGGAPMALGCASSMGVACFAVRNEAKGHGTRSRIVGPLNAGDRVVLVEDVVTTFASLISAIEAVQDVGGIVVAVVCLVNRGNPDLTSVCGIPFVSVITPAQLGIV